MRLMHVTLEQPGRKVSRGYDHRHGEKMLCPLRFVYEERPLGGTRVKPAVSDMHA